MGKHFLNLMDRAWKVCLAHGSSTGISVVWLGFGVLLMSCCIALGLEWWTGGRNRNALMAAFKNWKGWAGAFLALIFAWAGLFAYSVVETIYQDHQMLVAKLNMKPAPDCPTGISAPIIPHVTRPTITIKQNGTGNTANPGQVVAPIKQGDCGVVQSGGSGNVAAPNCAPLDRRLSKNQADIIAASARDICKSSPAIAITAADGNQEAQRYAEDFVTVMNRKEVGCHANLALPIPGLRPNVVGIIFGIRGRQGLNDNEIEFFNGLKTAGIEASVHPLEADFFPQDSFVLVVGARE